MKGQDASVLLSRGVGEGIEVARPYRKNCLEELGDFIG